MIRNCIFIAGALFATSGLLAEESAPDLCTDKEVYALLDFWVGEWAVYAGDEKVGDNRIEKILNGCAIAEHWEGSDGSKGQSLFFVDTDGDWQQVWVTEWAANPGGVKQKSHIHEHKGNGVRFQGSITYSETGSYLDRTTLTPNEDGTTRQLIEISTDGGESWKATFDATYRRVN